MKRATLAILVTPFLACGDAASGGVVSVESAYAEPTPFDDMADAVLRRPIGEILPALCGRANPHD